MSLLLRFRQAQVVARTHSAMEGLSFLLQGEAWRMLRLLDLFSEATRRRLMGGQGKTRAEVLLDGVVRESGKLLSEKSAQELSLEALFRSGRETLWFHEQGVHSSAGALLFGDWVRKRVDLAHGVFSKEGVAGRLLGGYYLATAWRIGLIDEFGRGVSIDPAFAAEGRGLLLDWMQHQDRESMAWMERMRGEVIAAFAMGGDGVSRPKEALAHVLERLGFGGACISGRGDSLLCAVSGEPLDLLLSHPDAREEMHRRNSEGQTPLMQCVAAPYGRDTYRTLRRHSTGEGLLNEAIQFGIRNRRDWFLEEERDILTQWRDEDNLLPAPHSPGIEPGEAIPRSALHVFCQGLLVENGSLDISPGWMAWALGAPEDAWETKGPGGTPASILKAAFAKHQGRAREMLLPLVELVDAREQQQALETAIEEVPVTERKARPRM